MTSQRIAVLFIAAILSVSLTPAIAKEDKSTSWWKFGAIVTGGEEESTNWWKIGAMAAGGVAAVALAPVAIGAAGIGAGGIVAGGIAAKAMALAAAANGENVKSTHHVCRDAKYVPGTVGADFVCG
ncbi:uncharacterized protein LOC133339371 isoform X3 [Lethenteron reissneri]|uniref:uncharacterized protein LOC133339371 isoform X3 n=1 Tax=Lethenteron reissneri TaxID=7753 RepID=UPI002AB7438E|nr:uncharacterized protein LOC133339371 isoform X3 [Lethenteron reissneri]